MKQSWRGVFPAVTTQLHQDQSLDLDLTARHIEVLISSGVSGLVMLGSLGENVVLTRAEKLAVMRAAMEAAQEAEYLEHMERENQGAPQSQPRTEHATDDEIPF